MHWKFRDDQGDALTKYGRIRALLLLVLLLDRRLTFAWQILYSRRQMQPEA